MIWYYKANFKTSPSMLKTKKEELYTHSFKYINCKNKYQINSNNCLFWKYKLNRDWHNKKL